MMKTKILSLIMSSVFTLSAAGSFSAGAEGYKSEYGAVTITVIDEETNELFNEDRNNFWLTGSPALKNGSDSKAASAGGAILGGQWNTAKSNPYVNEKLLVDFSYYIQYVGMDYDGYRYSIDHDRSEESFEVTDTEPIEVTVYMKKNTWDNSAVNTTDINGSTVATTVSSAVSSVTTATSVTTPADDEQISPNGTKIMTMEDVIGFSNKSDTVVLQWSDFTDYKGEVITGESQVWKTEWDFALEDGYTLKVCGNTEIRFPDHVYLYGSNKRRIDICIDDVRMFLNKGVGEDSVNISEEVKEHFRVYETYSDENTKPERRLVQDFKNIFRLYNVPIRFAFVDYDNIDDILASEYILQRCFVVEQQDGSMTFYTEHLDEIRSNRYTIVNGEQKQLQYIPIPDKTYERFTDKDFVKNNISPDAELENIYYLSGESSMMGTAIYYRTSVGDYVYYKEMLFPVKDFCKYQKAIYDKYAEYPDENGFGGADVSGVIDLSQYKLKDADESSDQDISVLPEGAIMNDTNEVVYSVLKYPEKTVYTVGEDLDLSGIAVKCHSETYWHTEDNGQIGVLYGKSYTVEDITLDPKDAWIIELKENENGAIGTHSFKGDSFNSLEPGKYSVAYGESYKYGEKDIKFVNFMYEITIEPSTLKGDTNGDGSVDMADAVLIMQALANPDKYGINGTAENHLTEQGKLNGDFNGDGLTVGDALTIQKKLLGYDITEGQDASLGSVRLDEKVSVQAAEGKTADEKFAAAEMKLGVELLKKGFDPTKKDEENMLISPMSISAALAMTANGADGETLKEMENVLGSGLTLDQINEYMAYYMNNLPDNEKEKVYLSDSIWFKDKETFKVYDEFLEKNKKYYNAELYKAPFNDATVDDINGWVSDNTKGMIPGILDKGSLDPTANEEMLMMLINTLYFEADWQVPYEWAPKGEFTDINGNKRTIERLGSKEREYFDLGDADAFKKPYAGGNYSFVGILPKENDIVEYVKNLDAEKLLAGLSECVDPDSIDLYTMIPKFEYDYSKKLNDILEEMGMPAAFDPSHADFSKINDLSVEGADPLYISTVLHKTKIEVTETGTKAAAATAIGMAGGAMYIPKKEVYVYLDRPFVYMIVDKNNVPLFMGVATQLGDLQ